MATINEAPLPVRLRLSDYLILDGSGAFADYGKTELLDGEIVYINAQHRPHARIKSRLHILLAAAILDKGFPLEAVVEGSIAMPPHSAPEPAIVLTAEPEGEGLIPLLSVALVVEVANATIDNDLGHKVRIYALAQVPEYWVVDVRARVIHQLWAPAGDRYAQSRQHAFGDRIEAATVAGLGVETATL